MTENRPTAIFAFNDMMALGVLHAVREEGLSVPDDISIMGSDNMDELSSRDIKLTTIEANIDLLAFEAVDYLFNHNTKQVNGIKWTVPVSIISGETVKNQKTEQRDEETI